MLNIASEIIGASADIDFMIKIPAAKNTTGCYLLYNVDFYEYLCDFVFVVLWEGTLCL